MVTYLVIAAGLFNLFATVSYTRDTFLGRNKPNRVSWILWTVAPLIAAAAAFTKGAGWVAFPILISGLAPAIVLIASFFNPKAYWKLGPLDYLCGACSVFALILWGITQEAAVAILFALLSDLFATLPTLIKAWKHPETESALNYIGALVNSLAAFLVMQTFDFANLAFPVYLVCANVSIILALLHGTKRR
ncbi:MAG: hypothetical protein AAB383_02820 [Patescibacteria group bacterium]